MRRSTRDRAVWQHLMADDVWRMDYQMDEQCDPQAVSRPEVAGARLRAQLGPDVEFEFVWIGPYQYRDHLLDDFRHGRLFFIGDSAHVVSPFGARGGNSGIQDANNLGWKLALVVGGQAGDALLDSYHAERHPAAAENLEVTSRTTRFLAPRSAVEHRLRRAVIALARRHAFARTLVNTGRMSVPNVYPPSPRLPQGGRSLQNVAFDGTSVMRLLRDGTSFLGLCLGDAEPDRALQQRWPLQLRRIDADSTLAAHLNAKAGSVVLVRPDAYVAAVIEEATPRPIDAAMETALR